MSLETRRIIDNYPHRMGGHCGSGALRDLMDWAGLGWDGPPSEGLVFTLGGTLDLAYFRSEILVPPAYLVGRGAALELDLPRRIGGTAEINATDDPALGWKWVRAEIDAGRPVMVWADIGELPYLRVRLRMSRHDIVVIGYDDGAEVALIADNDRADIQEVSYDALARARSSVSFPEPTRHSTYVIGWPEAVPDLRTVAASAFAQSASTMLDNVGLMTGTPGADAVAGSGLDAASLFAEDIRFWPELFEPSQLEAALAGLGALIEKAGTGGGLFRRLLAQGCAEVAAHTGDKATARVAETALHCANLWSEVARCAGAKQDDLTTRAWRAAAAARQLPDIEHKLATDLRRAADVL